MKRCLAALASLGLILWSGCAVGVTGSAVNVTGSFVVVEGTIATTKAGQVEHWAQYGPTVAYGSETSRQTATLAQGASQTVRLDMSTAATPSPPTSR